MKTKRLVPLKRSREIRKIWSNYKLNYFGIILYDNQGEKIL